VIIIKIKIKLSIIISILFLFIIANLNLCLGSNTGTDQVYEAETNQGTSNGESGGWSFTDGGSSSDSYYAIFQEQQSREEVFSIRNICNLTEFFKNDEITMKTGAYNMKEYAINNVTIYENIPALLKLDPSSVLLEESSNGKKLSKHIDEKSGIIKYINDSEYTIDFGKINSSSYKYLKFNISTNKSGKYILNGANLNYKNSNGDNKSLQSPSLYLTVINHKPIITRIQIYPNPAKKNKNRRFTEKIVFIATFQDIDERDLKRCEVWSSINGLINASAINQTNEYWYTYKFDYNNLSVGAHKITFKIFDADGQYAEESIDLAINDYLFGFIPGNYAWTLIFAFLGIILRLILDKDKGIKSLKNNTTYAIFILTFIFFMTAYLPFVHVLGLFSISVIAIGFYLIFKFKLN
jgi:hypothetical protein